MSDQTNGHLMLLQVATNNKKHTCMLHAHKHIKSGHMCNLISFHQANIF